MTSNLIIWEYNLKRIRMRLFILFFILNQISKTSQILYLQVCPLWKHDVLLCKKIRTITELNSYVHLFLSIGMKITVSIMNFRHFLGAFLSHAMWGNVGNVAIDGWKFSFLIISELKI